jgi:hypothetical protein
MAANAGTAVLVGKSGRTYTIDMYVPDAVSTFLGFSVSGLAASTSPTHFTTQEPCTLVDVSIAAAPTAVGAIFQKGDANVNGATIRWANQLAANPNRMKLRIPLEGGIQISALQF